MMLFTCSCSILPAISVKVLTDMFLHRAQGEYDA